MGVSLALVKLMGQDCASTAEGGGVNSGYYVIDLETTGLSPIRGDRVIEIAAVAVEHGKVVSEFQTLVQVSCSIPHRVSRVHGITKRMLAGQPFPEDVYPAFRNFIGDGVLVAHNARFDISFLTHEFGRLGMALANRHMCTMKLARKKFPGLSNHRLETVARYLLGDSAVSCRLHRALDDARLAARVWLAMEGVG